MNKIKVCWTQEDFMNLNYDLQGGYGDENMAKYPMPLYEPIIGNWCYHLPNTMPNFVYAVLENFSSQIKTPALNKMSPGQLLPLHKDAYTKFKNVHKIDDVERIQRHIIFLEDSQQGHLMQIEDKWISSWQAGDIISWKGSALHGAYNVGYTNRYTLQITCYDSN